MATPPRKLSAVPLEYQTPSPWSADPSLILTAYVPLEWPDQRAMLFTLISRWDVDLTSFLFGQAPVENTVIALGMQATEEQGLLLMRHFILLPFTFRTHHTFGLSEVVVLIQP